MKNQVFKVEGMKCAHCEAHVEDTLKALSGVQEVKADRVAGNVTIGYDEAAVSPSDFKAAIDDLGRYELSL